MPEMKMKVGDWQIERQSNGLKRFMMCRNHKSYDAAISISVSLIRCTFEELKDSLDRRFAAYKAGVGN